MLMDGARLRELQDALISAFPTRADLEQMVLFGINEHLNTITVDGNLQQAVFELLRWAQSRGRLEELVRASFDDSKNPDLHRVAQQLGLLDKQTPDKQTPLEPAWIRWSKFLFTRRPGWVMIGLSVSLAGVLWGISSPMVPYMKSEDVANAYSYVPQNSNIYIYPADNRLTVFIAQCDKLSPHIDCTKIQGSMKVAFLAHRDTISVNGNNVNPQPVQAHVIDELILSDAFGFSTTYTTSNYDASGTYDNHWWPGGFALIGCGLLIASVALFVVRKRHTSPSV